MRKPLLPPRIGLLDFRPMSVAEIKEQLGQLAARERKDVAVFLRMLALQDDPVRQAVLLRRLKRMRLGKEVSQESVRKLVGRSRKAA